MDSEKWFLNHMGAGFAELTAIAVFLAETDQVRSAKAMYKKALSSAKMLKDHINDWDVMDRELLLELYDALESKTHINFINEAVQSFNAFDDY